MADYTGVGQLPHGKPKSRVVVVHRRCGPWRISRLLELPPHGKQNSDGGGHD